MKKLMLGLAVLFGQFFFAQEVVNLKVQESQKTAPKSELSKEKIKLYNGKFFEFVNALKSSDRKAMDGLISEKVKTIVTDGVLKKVKDGIDVTKKFEVLKADYMPVADGTSYPVIQYKYEGDSSAQGVVSVVFEEDGKILGIKPLGKSE
ncbi:peptidylprolyl isomerase [Chryseobacterium soli]|uniref:peptidylprolyl isomerase n=1 Tax=Chryseobacterium soli TaxID=445961 RepID=UPI002953FB5A|nr:peptidylprolyl isomerase [Chryseobacterium soli]MDV7695664.1 peptidylprolyl isomerase [Chryseobacterium soli]